MRTLPKATTDRKGLKKEDAEEEELKRMWRLVFKTGLGSKLYELNLSDKKIGLGGKPSVKALATVLQEERSKDHKPLCSDLQRLNLDKNKLTDEHMEIIAPVISKCRMFGIFVPKQQ